MAVAVTFQQLAAGKASGWTADQTLVLDALRRSKTSLAQASDAELRAYVHDLSPERLRGVASNVKGIFHEMLVAHDDNIDDDGETARLFEATNHPGADLEFSIDDDVVREMQLKAVQDPAAILEHFSRYPDIDVMATTEVYAAMGGVFEGRLFDSGVSNAKISRETQETLENLAGEDLGDFIQDGVLTSTLVSGALMARAALSGQTVDALQVRSILELAGIGAGTALTVDVLLNLV